MDLLMEQIKECPKCGAQKMVRVNATHQRFYELEFRLTNLTTPIDETDVTTADSDSAPMIIDARCLFCGYRFNAEELERVANQADAMVYDRECVQVDECETCQFSQRRVDWTLFCPKIDRIVQDEELCDVYKEYEGREQ